MSHFIQHHPWLFFWLVILGLAVLDNMVGNICGMIKDRRP